MLNVNKSKNDLDNFRIWSAAINSGPMLISHFVIAYTRTSIAIRFRPRILWVFGFFFLCPMTVGRAMYLRSLSFCEEKNEHNEVEISCNHNL